jgi:hypothetical protein
MPAKMYGSDPGSWIFVKSCQRVPRSERTRSSSSGSISRRPRAVVSRIGNTAIENAMIVFGNTPYLNQTMNKGPRATFGIMFSVTISGSSSASSVFDQVNTSASTTPTISASTYPPKISVPVTSVLAHQS